MSGVLTPRSQAAMHQVWPDEGGEFYWAVDFDTAQELELDLIQARADHRSTEEENNALRVQLSDRLLALEAAFRSGWNACEGDVKRRGTVNGAWYAYRKQYLEIGP